LALILFTVGANLLAERRRGDGQAASAPSRISGPFTLMDGDGSQVTDRDFRGKHLLVDFGCTSCSDVCSTTLNEVAAAMEKLGPKAARVQPLFVTVDPKRATPDVMVAVSVVPTTVSCMEGWTWASARPGRSGDAAPSPPAMLAASHEGRVRIRGLLSR